MDAPLGWGAATGYLVGITYRLRTHRRGRSQADAETDRLEARIAESGEVGWSTSLGLEARDGASVSPARNLLQCHAALTFLLVIALPGPEARNHMAFALMIH